MMLLQALRRTPRATHAVLAEELDIPPSLVNRYLKRLAGWNAVGNGREPQEHPLTPKGDTLLRQASWQFLNFVGDNVESLRQHALDRLRRERRSGREKPCLYGVTALTPFLRRWAEAAGMHVAGTCDEERAGEGVLKIDDLGALEYDCFILCDWGRAADPVLNELLTHYAPVINLFVDGGRARPEWR
jgi:hypothetical protein